MNETFEAQAQRIDDLRRELEAAILHAQSAANYFRQGDATHGCAHMISVEGHCHVAAEQMRDVAKIHRLKSRP